MGEQAILDFLKSLSNVDFGLVMRLMGLLFMGFWLIVVWWVWVDSGERSKSVLFRLICLVIALLPILGLIIYLIVRPKSTLEEIYWADQERRYLKFETLELGDCHKCGYQLQPGFIACPNCGLSLKNKCESCGAYLNKEWKTCPYCSAIVSVNVQTQLNTDSFDKEAIQEAVESANEEIATTVAEGRTKYARPIGLFTFVGRFFSNIGRGIKKIFTRKPRQPKEKKEDNAKVQLPSEVMVINGEENTTNGTNDTVTNASPSADGSISPLQSNKNRDNKQSKKKNKKNKKR